MKKTLNKNRIKSLNNFVDRLEQEVHEAKSLLYGNNYVQAYKKLESMQDWLRWLRTEIGEGKDK
jgi:hypothetical protein